MESRSFHIITFGCQMNEHDSERMAGILEEQGYAPAASLEGAGMVILNTCSIREKAEQKFYSELGRLRELKDKNPRIKIAVAGCIAQQEGKNILSRAPHVDMVFGPSNIAGLSTILDRTAERRGPVVETGGDPEYHRKNIRTVRADPIKAWVSIMYGCDNFCTYCVVPYLRGRERSRPAEDIVREVRGLAEQGCREVTLLGQNVNSYGKGTGEDIDFPGLLRVVNDVPGIERIRFVTSHPKDLSDGLVAAIRDLPKVCESIHLPVQSGSDRILAAMKRKYTSGEYLDKVNRLRDSVPGVAVTTDIIVGFPGESEEDFAMTMDILRNVKYDGIFAFKYSRRPNTAALKLTGHLPEDVKERRLSQLLALQREITIRKNREYVGSVQEVLVDGHSKKGGKITGRTRSNKVVNFSGPDSLIGSIVTVCIRSSGVNSLAGELCV
jgi:tRNA-2-methylthio-N6-dimethylallyladenosine synthase